MGYTFFHNVPTKAALVADILRNSAPFILNAHRVVGNHLWVLYTHPNGGRFVMLYLLAKQDGEWGYKPISEREGPCHYTCPVALLNASLDSPRANHEWREQVRGYHRLKAERAKASYGDVVTYGEERYLLEQHLGRRGWNVKRLRDGLQMRMKSRQLAAATLETRP